MLRTTITLVAIALVTTSCGGDAAADPIFTTTTTTAMSSTTTSTTSSSTTAPTTTTTTLPQPTTTTLPDGLLETAACRIPDMSYSGVGVGFPRSTDRLQPAGDVQVAVLLVDFPDVPATRTPDEAFALLDGVEEWFETVSYGNLHVEMIPHLEWLRMANPASVYADAIRTYDDHMNWIEEAATLADPDVDFDGIDEIVVLATPRAEVIAYGPTWTGGTFQDGWFELDGTRIMNGVTSGFDILYWGDKWLPHEMGHSLSFVDVYDYDGGPGFSGEFSMMNDIGGEAPEYFAWERWHAGWLGDDQVWCIGDDTSVTLGAVETDGGVKAVVVPVGDSRVVVVESRRAIGYDSALTREGAIVYVVDTSIPSGYGTIEVMNGQQALREGQSVTVDDITVTVTRTSDGDDTVEIDVP